MWRGERGDTSLGLESLSVAGVRSQKAIGPDRMPSGCHVIFLGVEEVITITYPAKVLRIYVN